MIEYITRAVCDNCARTIDVSEKAGFNKYQEDWFTGITFDVCPVCDAGKHLKPELKRRILGEKIIRKACEIEDRILEAN